MFRNHLAPAPGQRSARSHRALAALCCLLCIAGCKKKDGDTPRPQAHRSAPPQPAMKPAPATPIEQKKEELGGTTWNPAWDAVIERALPSAMLSSRAAHAVAGYCPRFSSEKEADKRAFWAYTMQALAGAEAGLEPTATVRHTEAVLHRTDRITHKLVRQEGLLQLTYDDDLRYGCNFDWQHDRGLGLKDPSRTILDPRRNLQCGIRILNRQVAEEGKPLVSRSSYFATLQPGTTSYQVFRKQMANVPAACGVGEMKPRRSRPARATEEAKLARPAIPFPNRTGKRIP